MTSALAPLFIEALTGSQPNATALPAPDGGDAMVRIWKSEGECFRLVARELDPNTLTDQHLHQAAKDLQPHGIPIALCGRVDVAMSERLIKTGWGYYDRFGNIDYHAHSHARRVRQRDPEPDPKPGQMLESLLEDEAAGRRATMRPFWSHEPRRPDAVDDSCFSQWYPAPFDIDDDAYPTAEHWLMAEKARLMGDEDQRTRILAVGHPGEAKNLGREVRWFSDAVWEAEAFGIAVRGNIAKFGAHPGLGAHLAATGDTVLVEASPVDRVWGVGLAAGDDRIGQPSEWGGTNWLGFALMEARAALAAESDGGST